MQTRDSLSNGYVIVTGHGRSGTNLLLDIVNESPKTMCRNEPDAMQNSPFRRLPSGFFDRDMGPGFPEDFRETLRQALVRTNVRDHFGLKNKVYFRSNTRAWLGQALLRRRPARRALSIFNSEFREGEWSNPNFYFDYLALERVLPVFKIGQASSWILQTHSTDQNQKILHIIREPVSFLNSWFNRYIKVHVSDMEEVYYENCEFQELIVEYFSGSSRCHENFTFENLIETELWRWRYVNETLLDQIGNSDRYKVVGFKRVRASELDVIREVYDFCALELDEECWGRIKSLENRLFPKTSTRPFEGLDIQAIIDRVLEGSLLKAHLDEA